MRTNCKRLTCVNRSDGKKNEEAIEKVVDRYLDNMEKKGWIECSVRSGGDDFFMYENYVRTAFTMTPQCSEEILSFYEYEEPQVSISKVKTKRHFLEHVKNGVISVGCYKSEIEKSVKLHSEFRKGRVRAKVKYSSQYGATTKVFFV